MRRLAVSMVLALGLAPAAHASPLAATAAAGGIGSPATVRYVDLNDDARVVDPQFSWAPVPGAAKYEVEVNSSNDWAVGSRVCCDEKPIGNSLSPVKLLPNNAYYWRVRALGSMGTAGQWSVWCANDDGAPCGGLPPAGFVKTFDDVTPTIPGLHVRDAASDATPSPGPSGLPTTDAPVIAWEPVAGASSYELRLSPWDTSSGGGFCNWTASSGKTFTTATPAWTPLAPGIVSPVGNAHLAVTNEAFPLADGASYCIRVRARSDRDAKGAEIVSDWTQIGGVGAAAFTYRAPTLQPCAATAMPESAYHDEPQRTTATPRMPLFTWDRVDGACGYYVVVAKDPAFTKVVDVAFTTVPAYAPRTALGPTTYSDETTSYYWAVMPSVSANGSGVSTAPQQDNPQPFDKRSVPPTLLAPKAPVTGEPTFRWTATEGAREYRIQVDTDPYFGSPDTDVVTDSTAYTGTVRYAPDTTLYWRVRADDENQVGLGWSDVATFTARPPETTIDSGPTVAGSDMTVEFSSNVGDATFRCRLDGPGAKTGTWTPCASPAAYPSLADGTYRFEVAASDLAGNTDATPDSRTFTIDTTVPDTSIDSAPEPATSSRTANLVFSSTKPGATFECKLDRPGDTLGSWTACASPTVFAALEDGGYTFSVRATDAAGNTDPTPATRSFSVDSQPPDTVLSTAPSTIVVGGMGSFEFASPDSTATFECRIDGPDLTWQSWVPCSSPASYTLGAPGAYTFAVRAVDAARNVDATPATWAFRVEPAPDTAPTSPVSAPPSSPSPPAQPQSPPHHRGLPAFAAPRRSLAVRHRRARMRFVCRDVDGCSPATFEVDLHGHAIRIRTRAMAKGTTAVAMRLPARLSSVVARHGRRGAQASIRRVHPSPGRAVRFRLVID